MDDQRNTNSRPKCPQIHIESQGSSKRRHWRPKDLVGVQNRGCTIWCTGMYQIGHFVGRRTQLSVVVAWYATRPCRMPGTISTACWSPVQHDAQLLGIDPDCGTAMQLVCMAMQNPWSLFLNGINLFRFFFLFLRFVKCFNANLTFSKASFD
jgi:hypothetical protein